MDTNTCSAPGLAPTATTAWPIAGRLLDALTRRDFDVMRDLFAPDVRFRALVPPGPFELGSADDVASRFRMWFGGDDEFEVVDASVGQIGERLYARWRVRMNPLGEERRGRVAEQHIFGTGTDRITAAELLCSGFQEDWR